MVERYQTCSILMLRRYISAPACYPLRWWNLVVTSANKDCGRPSTFANKVCSNSTHNEQVKTSVFRIKSDGSQANATLFNSRKILRCWNAECSWLVAGHLHFDKGPHLCFTAEFNIDYIFKYFVKIKLTLRHWNKWKKWEFEPVETKTLIANQRRVGEVCAPKFVSFSL